MAKKTKISKNKWYKYTLWALILLCSYAVADIAILKIRNLILPENLPKAFKNSKKITSTSKNYNSILQKNLFSADNTIPPALGADKKEEKKNFEFNNRPVLTSLSWQLIGTIVHFNELKSVATLKATGNKIYSLLIGEEIEKQAEITKIERGKVTFKNLKNKKMEFVEIKDENKSNFDKYRPQKGQTITSSPKPGKSSAKKKTIKFSRTDITKQLDRFNEIIQEANASPFTRQGSDEVVGFRINWIKPGSFFEKLGLGTGDIIKEVDGETVNNPQKALELWQKLKDSDNVNITIENNGQDKQLEYQIN